jgi:acetolactate synthase I/II/III large subunit
MFITGGQLIFNKLVQNNINKVFCYSGGAVMSLIDAFYNQNKINYYIAPHEQLLTFQAIGYAKSSNNLGVVIVTSGPGFTNTLTGILDAQNDSTPLLVLSGNVPLSAKNTRAFQEAPAVELSKPITKWSYGIEDTNEISDVIDRAIYTAMSGKKGSVHIDLPKCILSSKIDTRYKEADYPLTNYPLTLEKLNNIKYNKCYPQTLKKIYGKKSYISSNNFKENSIEDDIEKKYNKIIKLIKECKRPIIYAGQGVNNSYKLLREFAKKSNIPVTTTIHAMGSFDERDNLSLEFLGMHGSVTANYSIQNADLILALGSRFDDRTTGNLKKYAPKAFEAGKKNKGGIVHINIDSDEFNKIVKSHINIETDCSKFFQKIIPMLDDNYNRKDWINLINTWKKIHPWTYKKKENNVTQDVIVELNKQLHKLDNKEFLITADVGNNMMISAQHIQYNKPKQFIASGSLGAMGSSIPYGIGASLANPEKLIVSVVGDGGAEMSITDLKTINRYNLKNIKILIVNNNKLDMVNAWESLFYNNNFVATNNADAPPFHKIAENYNIKSFYCDNKEDLYYKMHMFLNYEGSSLFHVLVDTSFCLPLVAPGSALNDMIITENDIKNINKNSQAPN